MHSIVEITEKLELIKSKLKDEFIGIEEVIDQFIDAVSPWCTMSDSQTRPLVVNLWGMTGVGKTSLVNRFLELWDLDEKVINFNLGSRNYSRDLLGSIEEMYGMDGRPCVFILDEFQHAKTLGQMGKELENPIDRIIWQLLDDGRFLFVKRFYDLNDLQELRFTLELCLARGVKVENGQVVKGWDIFKSLVPNYDMDHGSVGGEESRNFVTERNIGVLFDITQPEFKYKVLLRDYLMQMNGEEIVEYILRVEKKFSTARSLDFSKSLIFVIGNLDEAFEMSGEVSADSDPDFFHKESKKITFSRIKEGLKTHFRMEEIARLGNIHLIYPAFSSQFFRDFIEKELLEISKRFGTVFNYQFEFADSVKAMLFEEGVIASQGFRPLRSSIRFLIESSLANLFKHLSFENGADLLIEMDGDDLILKVDGLEVGRKRLHLPVRHAKRKKLTPEIMAVTAVHEAAHALVYMGVFGKFPKMITISSSDFFSGGFVEGEEISAFENYDLVIRGIAVKVAGKKGEELVFGEDNQATFGSENDMQRATYSLMKVRRLGVLSHDNRYLESERHGMGDFLPESKDDHLWVKEELEKAAGMASSLLKENIVVFEFLIRALLNRKSIKDKDLEELCVVEGLDLTKLFNSYPPIPNYAERLEKFLKSSTLIPANS